MATQYTIQDILNYAESKGWYDPQKGITNPQGILTGAIQFGIPIAQIEQAFGMPAGSATKWLQDNGYGNLINDQGFVQEQTAYRPKENQFTPEEIKQYATDRGYYDPNQGITNPYGFVSDTLQYDIPLNEIEQAFGLQPGDAQNWINQQGLASLFAQPGGTQPGGTQPGGTQTGGTQTGGTQTGGTQTGGTQTGGTQTGGTQTGGTQTGGTQTGGTQTGGTQTGGTQTGGGGYTGGIGSIATSTPLNAPTTEALDPSQSTLSPNFGDYVYNMLARGEALANLPYQEYTGQRFAGPSELQKQAFAAASNINLRPGEFDAATQAAKGAAEGYGKLAPYNPMTVQAGGVNPLTVTSQYQAPGAYQAGTFAGGYTPEQYRNQYQAPGQYQGGIFNAGYTPGDLRSAGQYNAPGEYQAGTFDTGLGPILSVQGYMNPYQQAVTDIEKRELSRQADIARNAEQARLSQAGAYGGSRQAIMEAERQRNLMQQMGDIQTRGSQAAYDRGLAQRFKEAELGMDAQKATEQSRQFGYGQQMTAAELASRYGLDAAKAQELANQFAADRQLEAQRLGEQSKQFGYTQGMTAAELQARYGLDAQKAQDLANQFASNQRLESQRLGETSRQFGYTQGMTAADLAARYGLDAQRANQQASLEAQRANQTAGLEAARQTEASRQFGVNYGLQGLAGQLNAASTLGSLGTAAMNAQTQGLGNLMGAGAVQQGFAQQPLDFGYQQWQESMKYPYQQTTFMQSLLQGLPLAAQPYSSGASGLGSALQGGLAGLGLYNLINTQGGTTKPPGT